MRHYRKLASIAFAVAIPVGVISGVTFSGAAWAKTVTGSGTVSCTNPTATITFKPPLTGTGTSKESSKISGLSLGTCTNNGNSVTAKVTAKITGSTTNSCASFATGTGNDTVVFKIKWAGGFKPSTATFGPGTIAVSSGDTGFTASGGTVTGSFATTDATFTANIGQGLSALTSCVTSGTGSVSSIQISGGSGGF